jgi:hypothetical protein
LQLEAAQVVSEPQLWTQTFSSTLQAKRWDTPVAVLVQQEYVLKGSPLQVDCSLEKS